MTKECKTLNVFIVVPKQQLVEKNDDDTCTSHYTHHYIGVVYNVCTVSHFTSSGQWTKFSIKYFIWNGGPD